MLAYVWASPLTFVGLAVAFVARRTGAVVGHRDGVVEVHGGILRTLLPRTGIGMRPEAMTIGHVIVATSAAALDRHRDHEWVHVRQAGRWGPFFPVAYLLAGLIAVLQGLHPYHDNAFEREARGE